jgi:ribonuclease-3
MVSDSSGAPPELIGHKFKNPELLSEALTHRSYSVENGLARDNQRLEFLGDAALQIILTEHIFRRYGEADEGSMTQMRSALARQETLADMARALSLQDHVRMGKGETDAGGNTRVSTLSDFFESVLGAVYLDGGIEAARNFVEPLIGRLFPDPQSLLLELNPKGALQELSLRKWSVTPVYTVLEIKGPDHDPLFTVSVEINGRVLASGTDKSRRAAEKAAAVKALEALKKETL